MNKKPIKKDSVTARNDKYKVLSIILSIIPGGWLP